jgi:hypothetical protein
MLITGHGLAHLLPLAKLDIVATACAILAILTALEGTTSRLISPTLSMAPLLERQLGLQAASPIRASPIRSSRMPAFAAGLYDDIAYYKLEKRVQSYP